METIAFVQGVLSVVGIMMVGGMVWATLKINSMKHQIEVVERALDYLVNDLENKIEDVRRELYDVRSELTSQLDSRYDKLINQIKN